MAKYTMDVVIVGGSISGLFHAIVFKNLGHRVHVLERSSQAHLQSQAAGLRVGPEVQTFIKDYVKTDKSYAMLSNLFQVINKEGEVINSLPPGETMHLTTWSILYNLLKAHLLGETSHPEVKYETGKRVRDVHFDEEDVSVAYSDVETGISNTLKADLVIAADGSNSATRETVLPGLLPKYAGYVTWRGTVPENAVSEKTKNHLQDRVLLFRTNEGYAVSYHVPSENGSLAPGEGQFIWIWYEKLEEGSDAFREVFTDVHGKKHFSTIPRGKIQPEIWAKRRSFGGNLSVPFTELVEKTTDPFVSAIREFVAPKTVFHDGKLLLVGDAFALFRPHVAASTNQAAMQAIGLSAVFRGDGDGDLEAWERNSLGYARKTSAISAAFGEYCFTGKIPGMLSAAIKPDDNPK